jgi:DNA-binding response OmpR family regulator
LSTDDRRSPGPPPVLVVEHDPEVGVPIVEQLTADGYRARLARTAEHARVLARTDPPALALLGDLEPVPAALALLVEIRNDGAAASPCAQTPWSAELPVIVVSSTAQEPDLLRAFEAGTDDFLARPASYLELRARLRALLLRVERSRGAEHVAVGPLAIDARARAASLHGRPLPLPRLEYELLLHLAREPERVFTKQELLRAVWGYLTPVCTRTLDSHSSRLRRKLRARGGELWVVNVRGVGYRLI